ncbi:MAG TPA: acetyl/propionyl/methylcrotonyl-CoA carboxylase subunit alpha [Vitreimonas sp.]|uniref:acetyl/propionyl/methylcrotonyl-CoA carboxylase subunit alpha n=1 Tax=Vitreimonas sp. TaxID=3069702 RepID=UPI002D34DBBA|nr:acetyl/propionyl/methylcrotonyl-CoA carboxylase subunit alpha [Vitreimonas sp.]HYD87981.1 acetyl/propionyl/methylcrotonyl-CoA carboxylase subunit alpha [Vitreimonas sp.]
MFDKILIANRGEVAVRIIRTARRMGIKTAIVFSEADRDSLAVDMADDAVFIGPSPAAQSYLVIDKIVAAAKQTGAQAIHPGFGFLSEKAEFADRLLAEKITFIGPNPGAIRAMGDKIESKKTAADAGVSCVPGFIGEIEGVEHAVQIAEEIGYPVMIKASAGGGGKGIRVAYNRKDVEEGFPAVRAEAKGAFGDDRIFIEKFVTAPRHIEIQVLGDKHGNVVHLFERECSIQRRNQKVIEEAPSPLLDEKTRMAMGEQAVALAKAVDYDSAGTVEFVASGADKSFYFLEMNTRLQVEHPVSEMITGLDLVEQMIRVAAGEKLAFKQKDLKISGWAIESRIYAEDPYRNFLPSIGRLKTYQAPAEGKQGAITLRNETGVREGDEISMFYDPMIAKLITHGPTRIAAIDAQAAALDNFLIEGIAENIPFLGAVMEEKDFRKGDFTTAYIKQKFPDGFEGVPPTKAQEKLLIASAAVARSFTARRATQTSGRVTPANGWQRDWVVILDKVHHLTHVDLDEKGADVFIDGRKHRFDTETRPGARIIIGAFDGQPFAVKIKTAPEGYTLRLRGVTARATVATPRGADLHKKIPEKQKADTSKLIVSPMPGLVISIDAKAGQDVKAGEGVAVVEAMKMQNIIRAERDGVIAKVHVAPGASVAADEVMIELT